MVLTVEEDGSLGVRNWNTKTWSSMQKPNLGGSSEAPTDAVFSAVTGTAQRRVYGVVNATIHEWEFARNDPLKWTYIGTVSTGLEE